jgi:2-hydroxychromene-2-carboxylate isomerase
MQRKTVRFYYDPISPFAWLATKQIDRIEATGVQVEMQPVLFAAMLNANGQKGPAEIPSKRELTFRDVMRLADAQDLQFVGPPGHPFNPLLGLRMTTAISDRRARIRFVVAMMSAGWEGGQDISDASVLSNVARVCDLDGEALLAAAATPEVKQALAAATEQALAAGVFGVPTFEFEGELFWGADRIDTLMRRIAGHRIDEERLQRFLAQPPLAQRRGV